MPYETVHQFFLVYITYSKSQPFHFIFIFLRNKPSRPLVYSGIPYHVHFIFNKKLTKVPCIQFHLQEKNLKVPIYTQSLKSLQFPVFSPAPPEEYPPGSPPELR